MAGPQSNGAAMTPMPFVVGGFGARRAPKCTAPVRNGSKASII